MSMYKHQSPTKEVSAAPPGAVRVDPGPGPDEVSPDPGPTPGQPHVCSVSPRGSRPEASVIHTSELERATVLVLESCDTHTCMPETLFPLGQPGNLLSITSLGTCMA